jgi:hypothetical protein
MSEIKVNIIKVSEYVVPIDSAKDENEALQKALEYFHELPPQCQEALLKNTEWQENVEWN